MSDAPEVKSLGGGKYSFIVGKLPYTMTTQLEEDQFKRLVAHVQELVATFPPYLNQDERLIMALMSVSHQLESLEARVQKTIRTAQAPMDTDA